MISQIQLVVAGWHTRLRLLGELPGHGVAKDAVPGIGGRHRKILPGQEALQHVVDLHRGRCITGILGTVSIGVRAGKTPLGDGESVQRLFDVGERVLSLADVSPLDLSRDGNQQRTEHDTHNGEHHRHLDEAEAAAVGRRRRLGWGNRHAECQLVN